MAICGGAGTKQVCNASPEPVIYIVPGQSILGRLTLVPIGEHGTISYSPHANSSAFKRGICNERVRPGTGANSSIFNRGL